MEKSIDREDLVGSVAGIDEASAFETAEDGFYSKWVPSDEEKKLINDHFFHEIETAKMDHREIFDKYADNYASYRADSSYLHGGGMEQQVINLPIVAKTIDLIVSWFVVTIMRLTPSISFKPWAAEKFTVPVPVDPTEANPQGGQVVQLVRTSEELATSYELAFEKIFKEQLNFRTWIKGTIKEGFICGKSYSKVNYQRDYANIKVPKTTLSEDGYVETIYDAKTRVKRGESCHIYRVPVFNILKPIDQPDIQTCDWISELIPMGTMELRSKLGKEYTFLDPARFEEAIKATTEEYRPDADKQVSEMGYKHSVRPTKKLEMYEVWFDWPVRMDKIDENGKKKGTVTVVTALQGIYHMGIKSFLCVYQNWNSHGQRPYSVFYEEEEDGRDDVVCTVDKIKRHAALISQFFHIDAQNAIQMSNVNWFSDPDSPSFDLLSETEDYPGRVIPRSHPDEVEKVDIGRQHPGLLAHSQYLAEDMRSVVNLSIYEEGMHIPGRTAAAAIKQIMDAGYQKPLTTLMSLSDFVADAIRLWVETKRQFEPLGEVVNVLDPKSNEINQIPIRYPTDVPLDMFKIGLTAADEFLTNDGDPERRMMMNDLVIKNNQSLAQVLGALVDTKAPQSLVDAFGEMAETQVASVKYVFEAFIKDTERFVMSEDRVKGILAEREQALANQNAGGPPPAGGSPPEGGPSGAEEGQQPPSGGPTGSPLG